MGELLPTLQARRLRNGLTDYLTTTFALTDPDAYGALADFIGDPAAGIFKGPYVRLRLPFAPARGNWGVHLDWRPDGFTPYGHQAAAFERLSTKTQQRPKPTLVTTGTGSGKTESFLFPILDHVLRARRAGITGMKALILYPMNALANDQAERLAKVITDDPRLAEVTAGLFTGEQSSERTIVSEAGLITDRNLLHKSPPDILLTNYKMLDHLLLRPDRADMWRLSAHSLQYIVLDEFHTYDGAQGTDVAMLLRRLGLTVKSYWTDRTAVTEEDRARPLGRITPVATSATLGSKAAPTAMLDFAHTVFGEVFDSDAVIGETRLEVGEWLADRDAALGTRFEPITPATTDAKVLSRLEKAAERGGKALAAEVLATLFRSTDGVEDPAELVDNFALFEPVDQLCLLKTHDGFAQLVRRTVDAISMADVVADIFTSSVTPTGAAAKRPHFLEHLLAVLSYLRTEIGRTALSVDVHLWIRELTRIDRAVSTATAYHWSDDGPPEDPQTMYLPAIFCRHCGRSGWGARLAPTGTTLDHSDKNIRGDHAAGDGRFRALISAPAEAAFDTTVEGLRWFRLYDRDITDTAPDLEGADYLNGNVLPVLVLTGPDADEESKADKCPSCGTTDGIRFLGSAVATQLSVTLSNMFGDAGLDTDEKKALMFTDSVQDAAHRAGFVQARSHTLSLRSALRSAMGPDKLTLPELAAAVVDRAGNDPIRRYHLLAPDIVERDEFVDFWRADATSRQRRDATRRALLRLQFDIDLEFGLQSRLGRTLELTGSAVAEVNLGARDRAQQLGRAAMDAIDHQLPLTAPDSAAITRWVRGTVERVRMRGAIHHRWLETYIAKDANRRWVWGGRPRGEGMPAFPKGRPAPAFPAIGSRSVPEGFDSITAPTSWYAKWAAQCLSVAPGDAGHLAKSLFSVLAEKRVITELTTESGLTAYGLTAAAVAVSVPDEQDLVDHKHLLVCTVCRTPNPGSQLVIDQLDGAPCMLDRCPGTLQRGINSSNFYRTLYGESEMKRVVAREHTSLLPAQTRLAYEAAFKNGSADPQAPNVLVATPTLEMGIDIGDLSTVMLGSLPRTVSSYLQRVGRAGRRTGNSLVLAFVRGRGEHLPKLNEPLSVIQGEVRPPATFLTAEEILQRQYIAHIVDRIARATTGAFTPRLEAQDVLRSFDVGSWMGNLIALADHRATELLDEFLAQFDGTLAEPAADALRAWATPHADADSALTAFLRESVHRWNNDYTELNARRDAVLAELPEFERRANAPAATDDDKRDFKTAKGSLKLLGGQIYELTADFWISVLERYGVLPNYTLLDDSVTLDVGVTWIDPDTKEYLSDTVSYRRGSRIALTELAPGATFYAQGLAVQIDAVDLGANESKIELWRMCPRCGWAQTTPAGHEVARVSQCPRCHSSAVTDVSQQLRVVEMSRVSAAVRRDEAVINDARDERHRESFTIVTAADIKPENIGSAWFVPDLDFGAEYLRHTDIRWLNMGRGSSQGSKRMIAGQETATGLFRVCRGCGQLNRTSGRNVRHEHRSWCRYRTATTEHVDEIALARTLRTQAVLLHLPVALEYDPFAHPSLSAAILLGLRQVIGGSPEHLDVASIPDALHAPNQRALLIHDTVPGGTGYLAEFADAGKVWSVLRAAREVVSTCDCAEQERLACHKCLLPFAPPHEMDLVSRKTAAKLLDQLLDVGDDAQPQWDSWQARIVHATPTKSVGSEESPLEKEFYAAFIERWRSKGATVREKAGTYGPSAKITVSGKTIRTWTLTPQVLVGAARPDFELSTDDATIPPIAIFADGRKYHATPEHNQVADDADKRAVLRAGGHLVWAFGHEDLQHFKSKESAQPSWYAHGHAKRMTSVVTLQPTVVELLTADPITQLIALVENPDLDAWEALARWLPIMFQRDGRAKGDGDGIARRARDALDGSSAAFPPGTDMCWSFTHGPLVVSATMRQATKTINAVLALDDYDDTLEAQEGKAWKDWLRLSNWLGLSDNHLITTRSLLVADSAAPSGASVYANLALSAEWQQRFDLTVSDAERTLILQLAAEGVPLPVVGEETRDGVVMTLSWAGRVGVMLDDEPEVVKTLSEQGWTVCPPMVVRIVDALETNGVM